MAWLFRARCLRTPASLVACIVALAACGPDESEEFDLPALGWVLPDGGAGRSAVGLAHPGPWELPPATEALGEMQNVTYDSSGPWNNGANCAPWMLPGTIVLRDAIYQYFPQAYSIGGYNCRPIANTNTLSQHGTGRALDIYIAEDGGDADNDAGDPIGNWLVENAEAIGIQAVIWDRTIWKSNRNPKAYPYGGAHPHDNHLHVELNIAGANEQTTWFSSPYGPAPCDVIGVAGAVVSEEGPCFYAFGPSQYWRSESGAGHGGSLIWTNAFSATDPSNWARWDLHLDQAGTHRVEAYIDPTWGVYNATRYVVSASGTDHTQIIDQGSASGWTLLGEFAFAAGGGQSVSVFDNYSGTVPGSQHIVADAIRLTPVAEPPCKLLGPGGGLLKETGPCFDAFGPAQYWRNETGVGQDGSLLWTNAFSSATPSNYARWRIFVEVSATYEVLVYLDDAFAVYGATRYGLRANGADHTIIIDQSAGDGWTSIGTFDFAAGGDQKLEVYDNYAGTVPSDQPIVADAIRLRRFGPWCGNGLCDGAEACDSCELDCGVCTPPGGDDNAPPAGDADPGGDHNPGADGNTGDSSSAPGGDALASTGDDDMAGDATAGGDYTGAGDAALAAGNDGSPGDVTPRRRSYSVPQGCAASSRPAPGVLALVLILGLGALRRRYGG